MVHLVSKQALAALRWPGLAYSVYFCPSISQNHDYKSNPDKFKSALLEPMDEAEGSPRIGSSLNRNKKSFRSQSSRQQSTGECTGVRRLGEELFCE